MAWTTFAHGVGSRGDLPLPFWQFAWAAMFALVVSFVALGALWDTPRLAEAAHGPALGSSNRVLRWVELVARSASFALYLLVVSAALFGSDVTNLNLSPVAIYVVFWVVLQMLVPITGDIWRVLNPIDTLAVLVDRVRPKTETAVAPTWTYWLAPVGAFGFIFMELIHPAGDSPRNLGIAVLVYTAVALSAAWRWGRGWLGRGETFAVHLGLLAAMAPIDRDPEGRLRLRAPLSGLAAMTITPVGTATLLVVLGGVTFDGFGESELWRDFAGRHSGWAYSAWRLGGLVAVTALVSMLYLLSIRSMSNITKRDPRTLANLFAPSLVPIVFGYTVAHYLQLAVDETQTFVFGLSDPFGRGWDLFGGAQGSINFDIISVDLIAWSQALAVVVGHVAGVLVAHDRAVAVFDERDAMRSQYVMLFVMVLYSVLGLWLLLNA